jgi:hypothetical protein
VSTYKTAALKALLELHEAVQGFFETFSDIPSDPDVRSTIASTLEKSLSEGLLQKHAEKVIRWVPGCAAGVIAFTADVSKSIRDKLTALAPGRPEARLVVLFWCFSSPSSYFCPVFFSVAPPPPPPSSPPANNKLTAFPLAFPRKSPHPHSAPTASLARPAAVAPLSSATEGPSTSKKAKKRKTNDGGEAPAGPQLWKPVWDTTEELMFNNRRVMFPKPGDPSHYFCVACVLPLLMFRRIVAGRYSEVPCDASTRRHLEWWESHKWNVYKHARSKAHAVKCHVLFTSPPALDYIREFVDSVMRSGNMPCAPPPADPFALLTQAQRVMWARCSLPFELTPLLMRRPCDLKLGHEITSVVNDVMRDLGITWPPPRSGGGGGGNAQAELVDLTPGDEDDDIGDQDGNMGGSTGGGNAGGGNAGGGNAGGGNAGGGNKGGGTLEAFVKPGVVTFNSGYTSNWGLSSIQGAFGAVAVDDLRAAAQRATYMSVGLDEVVNFSSKILTIIAYLVEEGVPERTMYLVDLVSPQERCGAAWGGIANDDERAAARMFHAVWDALQIKMGLSDEQIDDKLVAVEVDGASVNTGAHSGVVARLENKLGRPLSMIHCVAHRTSLIGSAFLKELTKKDLDKMSPDERRLNICMRDVRAAVNAGAKASHVSAVNTTQQSIALLGGDGKCPKVPTLVPTRYFIVAPVLRTLLPQWPSLAAASVSAGTHNNQFKEYGRNAGLLLLAAAIEPAFACMNELCVYGQSSAQHVGSLRSKVDETEKDISSLYGLGGSSDEEEAGGDEAAGGSSGGAFSDAAFSLFKRYSTLKDHGGALVVDNGIVKLHVTGLADPLDLRAVKSNGGPAASVSAPLRHDFLPRLVEWAKGAALGIVRHMLAELKHRFPPDDLTDTLAIADVSYWRALRESPVDHTHLSTAATVIASKFSTASGGARFNLQLLQSQAAAFHQLVLEVGLSGAGSSSSSAPSRQQQEAEEGNEGGEEGEEGAEANMDAAFEEAAREYAPTPTDDLWRAVFMLPRPDCSEWLRFVALSYAVVLGTNDNERAHSRVKMLRTAARNRLSVAHLTSAMRCILHPDKIDPKRAFAKWVAGRRVTDSKRAQRK